MSKYICIHGHFYQPPRENPWTEKIDEQPSAYPFHDWNQRIVSECYLPNGQCQVLGEDGQAIEKINNYAFMSFNFGPTLLSWMQKNAADAYNNLIVADQLSQKHFDGHGSAIAQCYNHMIMPLANAEDLITQIIWGIEDFKFRFQRAPEGMWLPETAVDLKTLDCLSEHGIKFTILAPKQAKSVRSMGDNAWMETTERKLNKQRPYQCSLPSGRTIALFFYDGVVSGQIAFGDIISSAQNMLNAIEPRWKKDLENPLFSVAIDGETFGHHRRLGDLSLARFIYDVNKSGEIKFMNFAAYLEQFPPIDEVEIHENTAWSSSEGLARWLSEGGGCIHHHKNWNQKWRTPLREAMDYLRNQIKPLYVGAMLEECKDPWQERNDYIHTILTEGKRNSLLEMQKNLMFMYTSCGWFFDDISGLEVRQILQYAARAISYAQECFDVDFEEEFLKILERAESNIKEEQNGRKVYEKFIIPLKNKI